MFSKTFLAQREVLLIWQFMVFSYFPWNNSLYLWNDFTWYYIGFFWPRKLIFNEIWRMFFQHFFCLVFLLLSRSLMATGMKREIEEFYLVLRRNVCPFPISCFHFFIVIYRWNFIFVPKSRNRFYFKICIIYSHNTIIKSFNWYSWLKGLFS